MGDVSAGRGVVDGGIEMPVRFARELRLLRFDDGGLEQDYREFHVVRGIPVYRLLFSFVLVFQILLLVTGPLVDGLGLGDPRLWTRTGFGVAQGVVGLWALRQPWFRRRGELYLVASILVIGVMLALIFAPNPMGFSRMMTFLISTVILSRLRVRQAVFASVLELSVFGVRTWQVLPGTRPLLVQRLVPIGITCLLLVVAAYMLEQSERRDFLLTRLLAAERAKSERLLLNVLPPAIAWRLKEESGQVADGFAEVTVLFADIVSFTPTSARWGAGETVRVLNEVFSCFDELADSHGVEKIKTVGDGYVAAGGVPEPRHDHALAVVGLGLDMLAAIDRFQWPDGEALSVRIGIASGPAVAGVIGTRKFTYDLWGDTVSTAARMQQFGVPGAIHMTDATHELVRHRHPATARRITVKGKGRMRTWLLVPPEAMPQKPAPMKAASNRARELRAAPVSRSTA